MAILPQRPQFSHRELRREEELKERIRKAEEATQIKLELLLEPPKFARLKTTSEVLDAYLGKRAVLRLRDKVAAFYAIGLLNRAHIDAPPVLVRDKRFETLRTDLLSVMPGLRPYHLAQALQAAAYLSLRDTELLGALCQHGARRADDYSLRDVVSSVYSLGRLRWRDRRLLTPMLERAERDVRGLYAIDLANLATRHNDRAAKPAALPAAHGVCAGAGGRRCVGVRVRVGSRSGRSGRSAAAHGWARAVPPALRLPGWWVCNSRRRGCSRGWPTSRWPR